MYAWKDWYKSLCGLILLMAVIEHPDMPKTIMGMQGLNPWNLLLCDIILAWIVARKYEQLKWDMPRYIDVLFVLYITVVVVSFFRMIGDRQGLIQTALERGWRIPSTASLWSDYFINCLKWVIPPILLFDGCRTRKRLLMGLAAVLSIYLVLALEVIHHMPFRYLTSGEELAAKSLKFNREIGYHRVDLSMMLSGASWAFFSLQALAKRWTHTLIALLLAGVVFFGQALTAGRAGYLAWVVIGTVLCSFRWRKYLLLAPVAVLVIVLFVPGIVDRVTEGFHLNSDSPFVGDTSPDLTTVTAGRTVAWPHVIDKILEAPLFGYGRLAMQRTGLTLLMWEKYHDTFPHPHNAYLELLLDNGIAGFLPVFIFFCVILLNSFKLFRDSSNPIFICTGGACLSLVMAQMVAAMGAQTFYPREGTVGMWCAIALMLRVYVERSRVQS